MLFPFFTGTYITPEKKVVYKTFFGLNLRLAITSL